MNQNLTTIINYAARIIIRIKATITTKMTTATSLAVGLSSWIGNSSAVQEFTVGPRGKKINEAPHTNNSGPLTFHIVFVKVMKLLVVETDRYVGCS
jgi:hypothetical protein